MYSHVQLQKKKQKKIPGVLKKAHIQILNTVIHAWWNSAMSLVQLWHVISEKLCIINRLIWKSKVLITTGLIEKCTHSVHI